MHIFVGADLSGDVFFYRYLHPQIAQEPGIPLRTAMGADTQFVFYVIALCNQLLPDVGVDIGLIFLAGEGYKSIIGIKI